MHISPIHDSSRDHGGTEGAETCSLGRQPRERRPRNPRAPEGRRQFIAPRKIAVAPPGLWVYCGPSYLGLMPPGYMPLPLRGKNPEARLVYKRLPATISIDFAPA